MNTNPQLEIFLDISAWLTGFNQTRLQATGLTQVYFATLVENSTPADVTEFFIQASEILLLADNDKDAALARTSAILMPASSYDAMGQKLILMWYTGQWFTNPADFTAPAPQISPQSYVESLVWPAAEVHPPGAKQPGYASWAEPPLTIHTTTSY
jgi:hypothetical protein